MFWCVWVAIIPNVLQRNTFHCFLKYWFLSKKKKRRSNNNNNNTKKRKRNFFVFNLKRARGNDLKGTSSNTNPRGIHPPSNNKEGDEAKERCGGGCLFSQDLKTEGSPPAIILRRIPAAFEWLYQSGLRSFFFFFLWLVFFF